MIRLSVYHDDRRIEEITLDQGSITIGRKPDNDICLDDATVSGHHAQINAFSQPMYIEDLCSTNGTYVNGERVKEHVLTRGDVIMIGKHKLVYEGWLPVEVPPLPEHTMELSAEEIKQLIAAAMQDQTADQPGRGNWPKLINWVAQDASGTWWGFESRPAETGHGWQPTDSSHQVKLKSERPNMAWRRTLRKV